MKQSVLALAIKRIVWAELALTAALAPSAFAQSQPAPGAVAVADAVAVHRQIDSARGRHNGSAGL